MLAFEKAGLLRRYDPIEALEGLDAALGRDASDERRREALGWAFRVWRAGATGVEKTLQSSKLQVLTRSGWCPAEHASFSGSWTAAGRRLENYLVEAAAVSPDCANVLDRLLVQFAEWPTVSSDDSKTDWRRFLEVLGVNDGLRPVEGATKRNGTP